MNLMRFQVINEKIMNGKINDNDNELIHIFK